MKQGRAPTTMAGQKREPIAKAVSPGAVSHLGAHVGRMAATKPLYTGRGFEAPKPTGTHTYKKGSQT